jgi:cobalt-precorrin 5A hydrolase
MRVVLTAFTEKGVYLACRVAAQLPDSAVYTYPKLQQAGTRSYEDLSAWARTQFQAGNSLIFVSATGIAVRTIAPFVRDKLTDPAVLCVDELGQYVIPLLSGHVGGGNRLARLVASYLGGTAVISTATDLHGQFAVDEWAAAQGFPICDRTAAKQISAALLRGESVGFHSELPYDALPPGIEMGAKCPGFAVTCRALSPVPGELLVFHPKLLVVGIGCKKGLPPTLVEEVVRQIFSEQGLSLESVCAVASIQLKAQDEGIRHLAHALAVPCRFYTAEELLSVEGNFTSSSFVRSVTGVDNVCERSAVLSSGLGKLLVPKTAQHGVTVAVAQKAWTISFSGYKGGNL